MVKIPHAELGDTGSICGVKDRDKVTDEGG